MKRGFNRPHQPKRNLPITLNDAASRQPSSIDFAPMSDSEHENEPLGVVNPGDHPKVADPHSPKFAEAFALQRLADGTRVIERSHPVAKERRTRSADCGSSFSSSRAALRSNSILHAMALDEVA
jgi:hypothetical protein